MDNQENQNAGSSQEMYRAYASLRDLKTNLNVSSAEWGSVLIGEFVNAAREGELPYEKFCNLLEMTKEHYRLSCELYKTCLEKKDG